MGLSTKCITQDLEEYWVAVAGEVTISYNASLTGYSNGLMRLSVQARNLITGMTNYYQLTNKGTAQEGDVYLVSKEEALSVFKHYPNKGEGSKIAKIITTTW